MLVRWALAASVVAALLFTAGSAFLTTSAAAAQSGIVFDEDIDGVTIATSNATIDISKLYPAAMIRATNDTSGKGYGFLASCLVGYNASDLLENPFAEAKYHASMTTPLWQVVGPVKTDDAERGSTVTFSLKASVDMTRRTGGSGSGTGGSGQSGVELIEDWADVQFTYVVSTKDYNVAYPGHSDYQIDVNGTTELKFDISIKFNKYIYADRIALDMGLCLMDAGNLVVAPSDDPYRFYGYQADGISTSDPSVNETNGSTPIVHMFEYRYTHEQMFAFVEDDVAKGYFAWANKIMLNWSAGNSSLTDSTAYYGTDGECLRLYLSSPIGAEITAVTLDPSVGVFVVPGGGGIIRPPEDGGIFGSSAMSVSIGVLIGGAIIGGGVGVMYVTRRMEDEDPADVVSLERNRYYKGGR